jgi:hypothetical protein
MATSHLWRAVVVVVKVVVERAVGPMVVATPMPVAPSVRIRSVYSVRSVVRRIVFMPRGVTDA